MAKHKQFHLTARQDFGAYRRGDHIEDEAEVSRILGSEQKHLVVKVAADAEPEKVAETLPVVAAAGSAH